MTRPTRSQYEDLMRHVFEHGTPKADRTGTGTRSVFGHQMRFDLNEGFPLVTTKKVHFKSIALELLWFLRGDGNARWLQQRGVSIWDEWADPKTGGMNVYVRDFSAALAQQGIAVDIFTRAQAVDQPPQHREVIDGQGERLCHLLDFGFAFQGLLQLCNHVNAGRLQCREAGVKFV